MKPKFLSVLAIAATATIFAGDASAQWGAIKGRVVWGGDSAPAAKDFDVQKDVEWCLKNGPIKEELVVVDPDSKGISNVFAYLKKPGKIHADYPKTVSDVKAAYDKSFEEANKVALADVSSAAAEKKIDVKKIKAPVLLDQVHCRYVPHALAFREGESLVALNYEPVSHNILVSGIGGANNSNINMPPGSVNIYAWKTEAQPLSVKCAIHGWMEMYVMVFDHPYYAVTKKDGSFELKNVPAGKMNLVLRNPKYIDPVKGGKGTAKGAMIDVKDGETVDLGDIKYSGE